MGLISPRALSFKGETPLVRQLAARRRDRKKERKGEGREWR